MERFIGTVKQIIDRCSRNILFLFTGLLFVVCALMSFVLRAWMKPGAEVSVSFDPVYSMLSVVFTVFFILVCYRLLKRSRLSAWLPYAIYFTVQMLLILLMPAPSDKADAWQVRNIAAQIATGDFKAFLPMHYLSQYPNNVGIALFYALFFLILPKSFYVIKVLNLIFNMLTMFALTRLFDLLFPEKQKYARAFRYYIVFFLPVILLVNYTYGDIPSAFFITVSIYWGVRYAKTKQFKYCVLTVLMMVIAFFLRQTALLTAAAVLLYWIYVFVFKERTLRIKTLSAVCVAAVLLAFQLCIVDCVMRQCRCFEKPVQESSQPVSRWFRIGLPDNKQYGYWDKGAVSNTYKRVSGNREKLNLILLQEIRDTLKNTDSKSLANGYFTKIYWLWSEGTFESLKYGMGVATPGDWQYPKKTARMSTALFLLDMLNTCMKAQYMVIIFLSGLYFLFKQKNEETEKVLLVLIILALFGFYLFWEIKSRYLYPIYPVLLLTSFQMFTRLFEIIQHKNKTMISKDKKWGG